MATLLDVIAELQAIQASQAQFTQSDVDAAVLAAVTPLNTQVAALAQQVVDLNAQVLALPGQIHDAVLAEDVALAAKIKPVIDELAALLVAP